MRLWPIFVTSVALLFAQIASGQSLKPNEVISSITVRPISEPNPVLAADGRRHLAYELLVVNTSSVAALLRIAAAPQSPQRCRSCARD